MAATPEAPADARRTPRGLRHWARLCIVVAAIVAGFGAVLSTRLGGADAAKAISNVGLATAALAAAGACLWRAGTLRGRLRATWGLIGLGVLSWGIGQVTAVGLEQLTGSVPLPSQADIGYLGMVVLAPAGLLLLPVATQSLANRARSVLDGLMVAASLVLIAWIFVVEPLIRAGGDSVLALYVSLAYPLGDVVIVTIVIYMLALQRRRGRTFAHLALVGAGIAAFAVSDIGYAYLNLVDGYSSGGITDIGWFAGFSLILLAASRPVDDAAEDAATEAEGSGSQPFGVLLPYVAVLAALVTSVVWFARTGQSSAFIAYTRSALILLIVGRQLLTLLENRSLTRNLEARVADRTAELYASEQRFHALVQHSSDVVTVVDVASEVLYQSESVQQVFGYPAHVLTGRRLTSVITAEAAGRLADALRSVSVRPYATTVLELTVRHRDRRLRQAEITITNLLNDPNVGGLVLNTRDISERKELQEQLVHEAYHDALTQLANRALFREKVGEAIAQRDDSGEVTVLFLDLDGFKEVNDSLGHLAGDMLLVQVADRLTRSVREGDVVARFGGDEFAVLIRSEQGTDDAEGVAGRIVDGLHEPFRIQERDLHVRGSVGLAAYTALGAGAGARGDDAEQLMRNADLAMYKAKATGGSGYASYDPRMLSGLVERLELEADLRQALDRGELELHYQPTIDMVDNRVIGFEALVRWRHPVRGLIPPMNFIPIAEATGLIVPLGRWVLAEACRQAMAWAAQTGQPPVKMAVNVSVRQFDRADLAAEVLDVLRGTGMPADRLCLEMTESVLMTDTEENLAQLVKLKALGVTLAIDDFGTGYSSLAYLRRFPVDTLKIDRSFVERLGEQTDDAALASTIVQLGQSLGMSTVAEGIEEYGQLAALRAMGCTFAQGFYFSRPVPAADAGRLLLDSSPELLENR
ncbi:bifunctional diguanylate cyclase/phosphodiesterase [Actinoplanes sp. N902-109]|uniref:putative bifunctional diguanylate cyclase/phosphodiesterase n=1 Tax=Actinoplanes sp. (strain N902-109) TaxID=649831 RepID=UPI00032955E0|nr:bifunctional diguanylate cyclase/phosphodiesterase [Actinoplanes sp. N902-109]AGL20016.1 Sensory box/GGDEF [Actinoplanes sp. N902-109]